MISEKTIETEVITMLGILLVLFWLGVIIAVVNLSKQKSAEKELAQSEEARKRALDEKLENLRQQGEKDAVLLVDKVKKETS